MVSQQQLNNLLLLAIFTLISSCNKVPKVICHATLYQEVIEYYSYDDVSKDKRKAAKFLFENIANKSTYIDNNSKLTMDSCIASFRNTLIKGGSYKRASKYIKNHYVLIDTNSEVEKMDINVLSEDFLINHIDSTYTVWQKTSQAGGIDFETYCNYILPYRVVQEPIEQSWDPQFRKTYQLSIDSLINGETFEPIIQHIIQNEQIELKRKAFSYPYSFSIKQIFDLKCVTSCDNAAIYFAMLFRSLGLPATVDITKRSYRNSGHSLLAIYWKKTWYSFEIPDGTITLRDAKLSLQNFPKVNRLAYSNSLNYDDVTNEYSPTIKFTFKKDLCDRTSKAVALFNNAIMLEPLAIGISKLGKKVFIDNMGIDCIYALGSIYNDRFVADSIVFVDTLGQIRRLRANYHKRNQLVLSRKYLMDKRQFICKRPRIESINGICIEGFNKLNSSERDTVLVVSNFSKPYLYEFPLGGDEKYRYLQVSNPDSRTYIAECQFYDEKYKSLLSDTMEHKTIVDFRKEILLGKFPEENTILTNASVKNVHKMLDKKGLSSGFLGVVGKLILFAPQGISPSAFAIQARNDENHILIGDTYELMMWDKGWQSLGKQVAKTHELIYENVPSNALYWLRNLSRGKEEYPFIINDKGEQYWAGQAN